ncbi:MAG: DUF72 domain-containing protein [Candidatus Cyclobacteriaceae bacterium M3_2C_046]
MKFGRTTDFQSEDLSLPADHPLTDHYFKAYISAKQPVKVYFGGTKFGKKEWIGTIYPQEAREKDFLTQYTRLFNSIELNATFHRFPPESWINKWKNQVPDHFKFCPKLYQSITHRYYLRNTERLTDDFLSRVYQLDQKLGIIFMQLSDRFAPKKSEDFQKYIDRLPRDISFAVEIRHPDWFSQPQLMEETYHQLKEKGFFLVITDAPGRRDVVHMMVSTSRIMVRFVGNNLHASDYQRIDQWVERIKQWSEHGLEEVYFFMHQTDEVAMLKLLNYFKEKTETELNIKIKV